MPRAVTPEPVVLGPAEYQGLAGFRHHVRRFFAFSERAIEEAGLSPAQYQAMLAIKAHDGPTPLTLSGLAERLLIKLNSAVELVGRLETSGLVRRSRAAIDRRRIELALTLAGEAVLAPLAQVHLEQHREHVADLMRLLTVLTAMT